MGTVGLLLLVGAALVLFEGVRLLQARGAAAAGGGGGGGGGGPLTPAAQTVAQAGLPPVAGDSNVPALGLISSVPHLAGTTAFAADGQQFVNHVYSIAQYYAQKYGVPADVLLAINQSESNWGNVPGNSLFGIKGPGSGTVLTWEAGPNGERIPTYASFNGYPSVEAAYQGFFDFIQSNSRYDAAWAQFSRDRDWRAFLHGINDAGYATNPHWWSDVIGALPNVDRLIAGRG